jgi:hypothetical protein
VLHLIVEFSVANFVSVLKLYKKESQVKLYTLSSSGTRPFRRRRRLLTTLVQRSLFLSLLFLFSSLFLSLSLSLVARRVGLFFFLTRGRRTQLTGLHHAVFERVFLLVRGRGLLLLLLRLLLFREGGVGGGGPRSSPSGEAGESRRRRRRLGWTGGKHGDFALQSALTLVVVVVGSSTTRRCFEEWRIVLTVVVVVVVVVVIYRLRRRLQSNAVVVQNTRRGCADDADSFGQLLFDVFIGSISDIFVFVVWIQRRRRVKSGILFLTTAF